MGHLDANPRRVLTAAAIAAAVVVACLAIATSCGPSLRAATVVQQEVTQKNGTLVDYPPPPAQVEFVRKDPGPPCLWVDGEWNYVEQTWQWIGGGWYVPPEGCVYAEPAMLWFPNNKTGISPIRSSIASAVAWLGCSAPVATRRKSLWDATVVVRGPEFIKPYSAG